MLNWVERVKRDCQKQVATFQRDRKTLLLTTNLCAGSIIATTLVVVPNPNGIPSLSPGLRGTSYPGKAQGKFPLPQRGCIKDNDGRAATPLGLASSGGADPGQLVPRNPGLEDGIPLGFSEERRRMCPHCLVSEFIQKIEATMVSRRLLGRGRPLLVAVSGGVDSMVLLHVLASLASRHGWKLTVAHFNHRLRGRSSDADEKFVRAAAGKLGLPFASDSADVKRLAKAEGLSIEMAARRGRHAFFARVAKERGIKQIALAHHADDQVELFFLRLLRGAGTQGLSGMKREAAAPWDEEVRLIRPLLDCARSDIVSFAKEAGIRHREDASNQSSEFLRNRVRHELLPLLRRHFQPALNKVVLRQMEILSAEAELLRAEAECWRRERRKRFGALPVAIQRRILQLELEDLKVAPEFDLIESLRVPPGKIINVSHQRWLSHDGKGRLCERAAKPETMAAGQLELMLDARCGEGNFDGLAWQWQRVQARSAALPRFVRSCEWFDAERVGTPIVLRHWRAGDRFQLIGMASPQKLQDIFTNLKVPRSERLRRVVATTREGVIWWVEGLRIGERFKLRPETRAKLKWSWSQSVA